MTIFGLFGTSSFAGGILGTAMAVSTAVNLFTPLDLMSNSPYCLPYNSYDISSENLELDQLIILQLTFFFILTTCLLNFVLIL